ncbi:hypothetical protein [Sphingomonas sp. C3-2]|uniref:hypothetical protein n=1 Tax=Sphingomonas sp. C3-2 TaxID=3062169 RepID=UPI00294B4B96|nr:hypothetical protein [Sphingomonas sp. C3-2]WOK36295.1 hypothetical protein QYC26_15010 [Sphingomonas sp. C3-2]
MAGQGDEAFRHSVCRDDAEARGGEAGGQHAPSAGEAENGTVAEGGTANRAQRHDGWSAARQDRFFEHLAMTSNVKAAAQAAGLTRSSAYRLRDRDADFARRWDAALAEGYAQLEMEMLHYARFGSERVIIEVDGKGEVLRKIISRAINGGDGMRLLHHNKRNALAQERALEAQLVGQQDMAVEEATRKGLAALRKLLSERGGGPAGDAG